MAQGALCRTPLERVGNIFYYILFYYLLISDLCCIIYFSLLYHPVEWFMPRLQLQEDFTALRIGVRFVKARLQELEYHSHMAQNFLGRFLQANKTFKSDFSISEMWDAGGILLIYRYFGMICRVPFGSLCMGFQCFGVLKLKSDFLPSVVKTMTSPQLSGYIQVRACQESLESVVIQSKLWSRTK